MKVAAVSFIVAKVVFVGTAFCMLIGDLATIISMSLYISLVVLSDKNKPIQSLDERKIQLRAVRYVDEIVQYNTEEELYELLQFINPEVRIVGADHRGKDFTGHDLPIKIYFNSRDHQWSTTELRERIYQNELEKATVNKEKQLRESLELLAAYENN